MFTLPRALGSTRQGTGRIPRYMAILASVAAAATVGTALAAPAAEAAPYLGGGEARRAIGTQLHRHATYGAVTGSLRANCYRARRNVVRCSISFQDFDGDYWCGAAEVRETYSSYYFR